ncbi:hypothetical protein [Pontixanthobacter sp. CEM42]|uniref:hypothetical protein n=1 Tax=Pontixanthobacter sp. CEM42 TaxID=2792077 RepID=UPI001ADF260F|nr:hypothetical protein [Pontixanthobacter sp. CEM42]
MLRMSPDQAWEILGLTPCDDVAAIKRAYAIQLKAIVPDEDIESFQQLRLALNVAQSDVRDQQATLDQDDVKAGQSGILHADFAASALQSSGHVDLPEFDRAEVSPRAIALHKLLFGNEYGETEENGANAIVRDILDDEKMHELSHAAAAEEFLAGILSAAIPRSDSVIKLADDEFAWRDELEKANPKWFALGAAQRLSDVECLARLSKPSHQWHEAFQTLKAGPADDLPYHERVKKGGPVGVLVRSLRRFNPGVEDEFDPRVVASWLPYAPIEPASDIQEADGISWLGWLFIGYIVLQSFWIVSRL